MDDVMEVYKEVPTVLSKEGFDATADSTTLRAAMKGFGTNEQKIIQVIGHRTSKQRQEILVTYQQAYGRELIKDLKSELGGKFEDAIVALMKPLHVYLAEQLHESMKGLGTNERTLVEILCTRDNEDIKLIKEAFKEKFGNDLIKMIEGDTSGDFKRLITSMATAERDETICDTSLSVQVAEDLYKAGELKKRGTDEDVFNRILAMYSRPFLICVFAEYHKLFGHAFDEALKKELSGDLLDGMLAVYLSIQNRPGFFAQRLNESMKGVGTRDKELIRIIVSRCEIDLGNIKEEYFDKYGVQLADHVAKETKGDYKKILLALIE